VKGIGVVGGEEGRGEEEEEEEGVVFPDSEGATTAVGASTATDFVCLPLNTDGRDEDEV